jgi:tetratricopeptide (TPR) repeat protein
VNPADPAASRERPVVVIGWAVLIAVLSFVAFAPALDGAFLDFDDGAYVVHNGAVNQGLSVEALRRAFEPNYEVQNWHPLTWLSHQLDVTLFGLDPRGHHAMSIGLHALAGILCFLAWRALTGRTTASVAVALLFAVHPLRVESVAWISERKDVLCGVFFFAALWAYAGYAARPSAGRYAVVAAMTVLALLAKPMAVTLPCVLLLLDVWPLGRLKSSSTRAECVRLVVEKLPLMACAIAVSLATLLLQRGGMTTLERLPVLRRIGNAFVAIVHYLSSWFLPLDLSALYVVPQGGWPLPHVLLCVVVSVVLTVVATALFARGHRGPLVAWASMIGMLVPVIGLVQVGRQAYADRYTYLPLVIVGAVLVHAIDDAARAPRARACAAALVCTVLALFVAGARAQSRVWLNTGTLFENAVALDPDNGFALSVLARFRLEQGDAHAARELAARAIPLMREPSSAHATLSSAVLAQGDVETAIAEATRAVELAPSFAYGHAALGMALVRTGRLADAADAFTRALPLLRPPQRKAVAGNFGLVREKQLRFDEARALFEVVVADDPLDAAAYAHLAHCYVQLGDVVQARAIVAAALATLERRAAPQASIDRLKREAQRLDAL